MIQDDQIARWARYVKTHKSWKRDHTRFLDSQIAIANRFYEQLAKQPGGEEKIRRLRELR